MAQAEAWSGRPADAVRDAEAAWREVSDRDAIAALIMRSLVGQVYVVAGEKDKALSVLGQMMKGACDWGPNKIRNDPFWSSLESDSRFEAILSSAATL